MNQVAIYYFSGTGNSLAVARGIATELQASLIPVASTTSQESIAVDAEVIGVVFPIYDFKPPPIVVDFVRKLSDLDAKYLFAVCTYGLAPAQSLVYLDQIIASGGGHLAGGFAIELPHSGIGSVAVTPEQQAQMFSKCKPKLAEICAYVNRRAVGTIESRPPWRDLLRLRIIRMIPSLFAFLLRVLLKGIESLAFTANSDCNGCGVCERICPVNNIQMVNKQPEWADHCAGCFACLHWCPQAAISLGGSSMGVRRYHHPEVKLADMLKQRTLFAE